MLDTDALAMLPDRAAPEPLAPSADDEGAHPPGAEPLWSESWYSDFVDEGQAVGGWFRLGVMPNEKIAWINALLCGPDMPTVAVNDFEVALPDDPSAVKTDAIELTHAATEPLQTYRVGLRGSGQAYDDPSALLRGEAGRPVEVSMDLVWTTAGTPYQYRLTPRYEIPCTVSGTVSFDDLDDRVGRRRRPARPLLGSAGLVEHGLGVERPASDDGTHLHGVDLRIPGMPPMGVGYIQPPAAPLIELQGVTAREDVRRQRFTADDRVDTDAGGSHGHGAGHGSCAGSADVDRRPGQPVPAGMGNRDHRRRPHRRRMAGVEPQPVR